MNQETQNWVVNTLNALDWRTNGVWIGAHDRDNEMSWQWVTGKKITWSYWASGQGHNCTYLCLEHCGTLWIDDGGRWHDKSCSLLGFRYSFICQYDMKPATTTTTITTTTPTTTTPTTVVDAVIPEGVLTGLVVACVLGALLLLIVFFFYKSRKKEDKKNSTVSYDNRPCTINIINKTNGDG